MRRSVAIVAALLLFGAAAACAPGGPPPTLRVLAGSELADMTSVLEGAREATGVNVELTFSGSLDGAERIAAGSGLDAAWFSSDRYLTFVGATSKARDRKPIMLSPVVVGVRKSVAARLGWTPPAKVRWSQIADAAANGRFRFAMANPTASNSGFSALVGVDAGGASLDGFFVGHALTSASSGELAKDYVKQQDDLDGIVNYESVVLTVNESGDLDEDLVLIYPDEGIFTADYPLVLLDARKREAYQDLVRYLRRADVQDEIMEETARRPATHGVPLEDRFPQELLVEASFPANLADVRRLLDRFNTEVRSPSHVFYVLDTSGSMRGEPMQRLKDVMTGLAGLDRRFTGYFTKPPPRERATVILATTEADDTKEFEVDAAGREALRRHVDGLEADGNTVLWTSVLQAYELAGRAMRTEDGFVTSVVVLTDGDNTGGISSKTFHRLLGNQAPAVRRIPAYVLLFGEPETDELEDLAERTGGKVFDARGADLSAVAKEIRGYQ